MSDQPSTPQHGVPPGPAPEKFMPPVPSPYGAPWPPPYAAPAASPPPAASSPYPGPWSDAPYPPPPPRTSGTGLAIVVGVVVAVAALALGLLLVGNTLGGSTNVGTTMEGVDPDDPWYVEDLDSTRVLVEDLAVGDCFFDGPLEGSAESGYGELADRWEVDVVDCSDDHALEVVGDFELTGDRLPRQNEAFYVDLEDRCWDLFDDYAAPGVMFDDLWISFYYPSRETWREGDRLVTCVVGTDRLLRGSLVRGTTST